MFPHCNRDLTAEIIMFCWVRNTAIGITKKLKLISKLLRTNQKENALVMLLLAY